MICLVKRLISEDMIVLKLTYQEKGGRDIFHLYFFKHIYDMVTFNCNV